MTKTLHRTKRTVIILTFGLLASFGLMFTPKAHADLLDDFVSGIIKLTTQENYKLRTSINGAFNFDDGYEVAVEGNYQIIVGSQIDNRCGLGCKQADQINLKLTFIPLEVEGLETFIATANLNVLSYNQGEELYIKLNDLNLEFGGSDPEVESMQASIDMVLEPVKQKLKNKWISVSEEELQKLYGLEAAGMNTAATDALTNEFLTIVENADGKTGREVLTSLLQTTIAALETEGEVTPEKSQMIMSMAKIAMNSKLFRNFDVMSGNNIGFKQSILNRFALAEMTEKMMQEAVGSALSTSEKQEIKDFLNKISFSTWYRFSNLGVMDALTVYFEVNELEELKHFHFKYHQVLLGEGEAIVLAVPSQAMTLEEAVNKLEEF